MKPNYSRSRSRSNSRSKSVKLHIANLPLHITEKDIEKEFQKIQCTAKEIVIVKRNAQGQPLRECCYGFVEVETSQESERAISFFKQSSHKWLVSYRKSKNASTGHHERPSPNHESRRQNRNANNSFENNSYLSKPKKRRADRDRDSSSRSYNQDDEAYRQNLLRSEQIKLVENQRAYSLANSNGYQQDTMFQPIYQMLIQQPQKLQEILGVVNRQSLINEQILVRELWIGNLSPNCEQKQFKIIMELYGQIEHIDFFNKPGQQIFAFVKYEKVEAAYKALQNQNSLVLLLGNSLKIQFSDHLRRNNIVGDMLGREKVQDLNGVVYVSYLHNETIDEMRLKKECYKFGAIKNFVVRMNDSQNQKNSVLIEFDTIINAQNFCLKSQKSKKKLSCCEIALLLKTSSIRDYQLKPQSQSLSQSQHYPQPQQAIQPQIPSLSLIFPKQMQDINYSIQPNLMVPSQVQIQPANPNPQQISSQLQTFNYPHQTGYSSSQINYSQQQGLAQQENQYRYEPNHLNNQSFSFQNSSLLENSNPKSHYQVQDSQNSYFQNQPQNQYQPQFQQPVKPDESNPAIIDFISSLLQHSEKSEPQATQQTQLQQLQQQTKIKNFESNDEPDVFWYGFLARNGKFRLQVQARIIQKLKDVKLLDHSLNITYRTNYDDAFKEEHQMTLALKPIDELQEQAFSEYVKYFQEKQRAGVAQTSDNLYSVYIIPQCEYTNEYQLGSNELLALFVERFDKMSAQSQKPYEINSYQMHRQ